MRVGNGLHLVFSGGGGFDLTDRYDCHAWLVDSGDGWVLFDAGAGRDPDAAVAAIAASGVDVISVGRLTHSAPALDIALDFDG